MHVVPKDLKETLKSVPNVKTIWDKLTPLARNEWICWITLVKKLETRREHIRRACIELAEGKTRPCCWPGCPHRRPGAQERMGKK